MQDQHGRVIAYLRLSVTSSCPMRCRYCRPATWSASANSSHCQDELSVSEIVDMVTHLATRHGLKKVRLTGGEPTDRADLLEMIQALSAIRPAVSLTMTTNALRLPQMASDLAAAGLNRINISLDSLDRQTFLKMTGVDGLSRVLQGITAAKEAGLMPIKVNTVVIGGLNDGELWPLLDFAAETGVEIRLIELMPMGPLAGDWASQFVSAAQMRERLDPHVAHWRPLTMGSDAARRNRVTLNDGREALIGLIAAMSCPFCGQCDRIRVASDGKLFPCLMDSPSGSVLDALRPQFDADRLEALLENAMSVKPQEHPATGYSVMTQIGG